MSKGILILWIILSIGCKTVPVVRPAPQAQFKSAADLTTTLKNDAIGIKEKGTEPQSVESKRLVTGLDVIQLLTGPGKVILKMTPQELEKIKQNVIVELVDRQVALETNETTQAQAHADIADQVLNTKQKDIRFHLITILLTTLLTVGVMIWWSPTRKFAPFGAIAGIGALVFVILGSIVKDILLVVVVAGVLGGVYLVILYILETRKAKTKATMVGVMAIAIENTKDKVLKDKVATISRIAGVSDSMHRELVKHDLAKNSIEFPVSDQTIAGFKK